MKLLIEINDNFLDNNSERLIDSILKYDMNNIIDGFVYDTSNLNEERILKMASLTKAYKLELKFKGTSLDKDFEIHKKVLDMYNKIAKLTTSNIKIIYNPALASDKKNGFFNTLSMLKSISLYIKENGYNLSISLKNVEYKSKINSKNYDDLFSNIEDLKMSYDVGNVCLKDNEFTYDTIDDYTYSKIDNIYLYDNNLKSSKCPFIHGNVDLYEIFTILKRKRYNKDIVIEINEKHFEELNFDEKIKNYIIEAKKVDFIKSQFYIKENKEANNE